MFTSLASLAVVGTVHALAVAPAQHVGYGIASQCTNLRFPKNVPASSDTAYWLIGDCLTGADPTTRITSAISLGEKLGNADGKIVWSNLYVWLSNELPSEERCGSTR